MYQNKTPRIDGLPTEYLLKYLKMYSERLSSLGLVKSNLNGFICLYIVKKFMYVAWQKPIGNKEFNLYDFSTNSK